jgi:transcriptional regulator with XRE-family HTH domain
MMRRMRDPDFDWAQLGHLIRLRREALGLTQAEAAVAAGISATTWRAVEAGNNSSRGLTNSAIARVLGWHPSSISDMVAGRISLGDIPLAPAEPVVKTEIAALSGKLDKLSPKDRRYIEDLVDRLLDDEA